MSTENPKHIEKQIETLKTRLAGTGPMRPGTLTVQYRDPAQRRHPFNQLSYTHQAKSRSDYIRPEHVAAVRREIAEYKRFRMRIDKLVALSIQASRGRMARSR